MIGLESSSHGHVLILLINVCIKVRIAIRGNPLPPTYDIDANEDVEFKAIHTEVDYGQMMLYICNSFFFACLTLTSVSAMVQYLRSTNFME